MYSQCPDCQTRFRVTAEALRAARGTVRCGRCGSAFDALERLSDSIPPAVAEAASVPLEVASPLDAAAELPVPDELHFSADDLERVFVDARDWQAQFGTPARSPAEPSSLLVDENTSVEDITLEGERIAVETLPEPGSAEIDLDATDQFDIPDVVPESELPEDDAAEIEELVKQLTGEAAQPAATPESSTAAGARAVPLSPAHPAAPEPALGAQRWRPPPPVEEEPELGYDAEPDRRPRWGRLVWTAGSLALVLVLVGQVVHYYRQDLVRHPQLGGPLRALYERLGVPLQPNWDLGAFELRQWGNDADAPGDGRLVVRASLTNRAPFAQPHPILRLELDDRFGGTVATRDFEPADYLKDPGQAGRLVAPGSTSEAELLLADPGGEAVGYRLDVCLRESAALLRCARGPG